MTGNLLVRSVAIRCWGSMILAKMWLERVSNVSIGSSSFGGVPWVLLDLIFFLVCFMQPFVVSIEVGRWFISSTVMLVQVVKCPLLVAWSKVFFTGINRFTWYHLYIYGLILSARALSADGCWLLGGSMGLLVRLTCHMTDVVDLLPSSTVSPSLTTLSLVAVKVYMQPLLHSCPIGMGAPSCRWG